VPGLLDGRIAVVYGAGGAVGSAVARAFGAEGARVFLAGRTQDALDRVAGEIASAGGSADTAVVDAIDEDSVDRHADEVVREAGRIDVSFNAVGHGDVHGAPLLEMPVDDFLRPIAVAMRTQFLTTRAAARHMIEQGSGVIMAITATTARMRVPHVGGTWVSFDAIESQSRQWATELGPHGIRVVWVQTTGLPEGLHAEVFPAYGTGAPMDRQQLVSWLTEKTLLGRLTSMADLGHAAAFLASDHAAAITGCGLNLSIGSVPG
jgi:NAD(P)-dependent dehydrogenase (short-subunit alcohol dehydrogenase family)